MSKFLFILTALLLIGPFGARSQSTSMTAAQRSPLNPLPIPDLIVSIEPGEITIAHRVDTVDILFNSAGQEISAFDLVTVFDASFFDLIEVLPGTIVDSCRWEYFTESPVSLSSDLTTPEKNLSAWRITGLAEMIPDSVRPICYGFEEIMTLARLVIGAGETGQLPDTTIPIQFYWQACGNNSISDKTGNKLFLSSSVYNADSTKISSSSEFPSMGGAISTCINRRNPNAPVSRIIFYNGSVSIGEIGLDTLLNQSGDVKE